MKKTATIILSSTIALSLMLAGCGKASDSGNNNSATPAATTEATPSGGTVNNDSFTLTVSAWFLDDHQQSTETKAAAEKKFKAKYPNAKVQWDVLVSEKYMDKVKADLAAGSADDVIFNQSVPVYAKAGYLADLSDQPWVSNMLDATRPFETLDNKVFGAAASVATTGVFYNKKMFADNGIQIPKTWADFLAAADKLKAANITPIIGGFKDQWTVNQTLAIFSNSNLLANNPKFEYDVYDGKLKLNGPEMKTNMDQFNQLFTKGEFNKDVLSLDWPGSMANFEAGKAAMILQGNWIPGMAADDFKTKKISPFDLGFFPMPGVDGKAALGASPDHSVAVNAKSKHLQAAKDFVTAFLSQDVLSVHNRDIGLSGIKGINVDYAQPAMKEVMDALNTNTTVTPLGSFLAPSAMNTIIQGITKEASGGNFGSTLDEAQKNQEKDKATIVIPAH